MYIKKNRVQYSWGFVKENNQCCFREIPLLSPCWSQGGNVVCSGEAASRGKSTLQRCGTVRLKPVVHFLPVGLNPDPSAMPEGSPEDFLLDVN